jgi:hypothetical protein
MKLSGVYNEFCVTFEYCVQNTYNTLCCIFCIFYVFVWRTPHCVVTFTEFCTSGMHDMHIRVCVQMDHKNHVNWLLMFMAREWLNSVNSSEYFNIICSMHCNCNHPYTPTHAHNLYNIINNPYTPNSHVSVINHLPQGDRIQRQSKPTHPICSLFINWMYWFCMPSCYVSLRMAVYDQNTQENSHLWII